MTTSFRDLEFSRKQLRIIRKIKRKGHISKQNVNSNTKYNFLIKYSLLDYSTENHNDYILSDKALMYLRFRSKDIFRTWYPHVVATLALLASVASLVISFVSLYLSGK